MFNLFKFTNKKDIKKVAEKQLVKNAAIIKSLKDYDEGKKDISTSKLEQRLPYLHLTP